MKNRDFLLRGSFKNFPVRFSLVETTDTVQYGLIRQNTDPIVSFVFGRALTSAALIAPLLEGEERYSIRWDYDGLISGIIANVNAKCEVRGVPKAHSIMPDLKEEEEIYGEKGSVSIIKSVEGKVRSSSACQAEMLSVTDDIGFFFSYSDQIETELSTGILFNPDPEAPVRLAAGFMLQVMPDCDLEQFAIMRQMIKTDEFMSMLMEEDAPSEQKLRQILNYLIANCDFLDSDIHAHEACQYEYGESPAYVCNCSKEKMKEALKTLPEAERKELRDKGEALTIRCEFCQSVYEISDF